jgi:hypothetical protein
VRSGCPSDAHCSSLIQDDAGGILVRVGAGSLYVNNTINEELNVEGWLLGNRHLVTLSASWNSA